MNKGSDITTTFIFKDYTDNPDGVVVDISGFVKIDAYVYQDNEQILKKFTLNDDGDAESGDVTIVDAVNGKIKIYVPRSVTKKMRSGKLYADIKVGEEDADAEDGIFVSEVKGIVITEMNEFISHDDPT